MADELKPVDDPMKQLTAVPWYDAGIIRALLSALALLAGTIATLFFGVDEAAFNQTAEKVIAALMSFLAVGVPIGYAIWARIRRPTPPVKASQANADKHNATMIPPEIKAP